MSQPSDQQLKKYEREILRARSRVQVADLDTKIDRLIGILIGKLTRAQHQQYQAARLQDFLANPELIIANRVLFLGLSEQEIKRLTAPDILTMEEVASLVVIMRAIRDWLQSYIDSGEKSPTFRDLVQKAGNVAAAVREEFLVTYQRYPSIDDVPEEVMMILRARGIKRLADKAGILLSAPQEDER